jgi:DNA-binding transcriptional MerR regulator
VPHRETPTSQRLYDERDRARLKLILRGKRFGYSLAELVDILELYEVDPTQKKQITRTLEYGIKHIQEIDERIEELREIRAEMLEFAKSFLDILQKDGGQKEKEFLEMARGLIGELEKKQEPA